MALEFIDGFDHYNNSTEAAWKWDTTVVTSGFSFSAGRFGTGQAIATNTSPNLSLTQGQLASVATRTIGFAALMSPFPGNMVLVRFMDGATEQVSVRTIAGTNQLYVSRNGTTLATASQSFIVDIWNYIEFQATIGASGSFTLKVNGAVWLNVTGVNTQSTTNATSNGIQIPGLPGSYGFFLDDLYICNSSGSVNNNFLGECRIYTQLPNANGATDQWTPNPGTNANWQNVSDNPPDSDTTYNSTTTAGQIDLYKFPAVSPTGPIVGVQVNLSARKDDVGTRTLAVEYQDSGGTNHVGANQFSPASSYLDFRQLYDTDPATGAAWSTSGLNGGQFGVNCIA